MAERTWFSLRRVGGRGHQAERGGKNSARRPPHRRPPAAPIVVGRVGEVRVRRPHPRAPPGRAASRQARRLNSFKCDSAVKPCPARRTSWRRASQSRRRPRASRRAGLPWGGRVARARWPRPEASLNQPGTGSTGVPTDRSTGSRPGWGPGLLAVGSEQIPRENWGSGPCEGQLSSPGGRHRRSRWGGHC